MKFSRTVKTAVQALKRNAMRAVLTALGIIIGIAAVIVMVEIGQGSSAAIQSSIATMGANNIMIFPGTAASGGVSFGAGSIMTLTAEDSDAILREVGNVRAAAPVVRARAQLVNGSRNWVPQTISGTTPAFVDVRDWSDLAEGEMFTDRDVRNGNKVCVIGQTIVRELFGGEPPVGRELRIQNVAFKVVGVLSRKGANMMGSDQDDIVLAPWTTIKYRVSGSSSTTSTTETSTSASSSASSSTTDSNSFYPTTGVALYPESTSTNSPLLKRFANVDQIVLGADSSKSIPGVIEDVTQLLRERHHLREGDPDDFRIRDMAEMTKVLTSTSGVMTKLLLCVACISLMVGGVGIMNIMLVSVTERTREIGLRMAVGARGRDIMQQFLVEAVMLCAIGGITGIVLGRGTSLLVTAILHWPTRASLPAVLAAFLVSVGVGIVFGYYPAARAAKLDPIEALRYE